MACAGFAPHELAGTNAQPRYRSLFVDELAFEHVSLFDLDVLVVRQNRARREPHKRGHEASLLVKKETLYLAAGKACLFPFHLGWTHDVRVIAERFGCGSIHQ